jgi:hypothetical protein
MSNIIAGMMPLALFLEIRDQGGINTLSQLLGTGQVETAPRTGFGLVSHLFKCICLERSRGFVCRIGKSHMVHHLGNPAVFEGFAGLELR